MEIPRTTYSQYGIGEPVSRSELRPGDLLFFDHVGHVGMYVGGGRFIHAPHTGTVVQFGTLSGWYLEHFVGARPNRRLIGKLWAVPLAMPSHGGSTQLPGKKRFDKTSMWYGADIDKMASFYHDTLGLDYLFEPTCR